MASTFLIWQVGLVDAMGAQLANRASIRVASHEYNFLRTAVATTSPMGPVALPRQCERAIASVISARSRVGWTSWGHTATDVPLHAYGPGSERFVGALDNAEIGAEIEGLMGWDLASLTAKLGTPVMAPKDATGAFAQFATWPEN